jgi:hypothetical protein
MSKDVRRKKILIDAGLMLRIFTSASPTNVTIAMLISKKVEPISV